MTVIEVFADVACPFTHVGLRRFVDRRTEVDRPDVELSVRAWPLEVVNGAAMDPHLIADEVDDLRSQVAPDLFVGFVESAFPATSMPALELAAAAYTTGVRVGEQVSLRLRHLLFEQGVDIADPEVLAGVAAAHGVRASAQAREQVLADHAEGVTRGVIGSPHFFTPGGDFFCPSLDITRDADGHLDIGFDRDEFERFLRTCFA